jgi:hypothetical protein
MTMFKFMKLAGCIFFVLGLFCSTGLQAKEMNIPFQSTTISDAPIITGRILSSQYKATYNVNDAITIGRLQPGIKGPFWLMCNVDNTSSWTHNCQQITLEIKSSLTSELGPAFTTACNMPPCPPGSICPAPNDIKYDTKIFVNGSPTDPNDPVSIKAFALTLPFGVNPGRPQDMQFTCTVKPF